MAKAVKALVAAEITKSLPTLARSPKTYMATANLCVLAVQSAQTIVQWTYNECYSFYYCFYSDYLRFSKDDR